MSDWIIRLNSCFSKRKNYISEKSKGRIYRSISMKRKKTCRSLWSHGQSMMILRKKKKRKNVQEEPIKLSKTNIHSLITLSFHPLEIPWSFSVIIGPIKSSIPSHEITERRVSLYLSLNRIIRSILLSSFRLKFRRLFLFLLRQRNRRMIVKTLGHQLKGERILLPAGLLDLRPLVLKPDLDLRLVQAQIPRELLPPPLG